MGAQCWMNETRRPLDRCGSDARPMQTKQVYTCKPLQIMKSKPKDNQSQTARPFPGFCRWGAPHHFWFGAARFESIFAQTLKIFNIFPFIFYQCQLNKYGMTYSKCHLSNFHLIQVPFFFFKIFISGEGGSFGFTIKLRRRYRSLPLPCVTSPTSTVLTLSWD